VAYFDHAGYGARPQEKGCEGTLNILWGGFLRSSVILCSPFKYSMWNQSNVMSISLLRTLAATLSPFHRPLRLVARARCCRRLWSNMQNILGIEHSRFRALRRKRSLGRFFVRGVLLSLSLYCLSQTCPERLVMSLSSMERNNGKDQKKERRAGSKNPRDAMCGVNRHQQASTGIKSGHNTLKIRMLTGHDGTCENTDGFRRETACSYP
jgi:hypothetical protein